LPGLSRNSQFSHLPRIIARATLFLLPVVLLVLFFAVRALHQSSAIDNRTAVASDTNDWQDSFEPASARLPKRAVFPYSIVPGGVRDAQELQSAASADPVVARHYSDFRMTQARALRLDHPLSMYVSYRHNNQVFWTKNRMVIPAGEALISDGENLARVRCGNRLSPVAAKPVAATEPSQEELTEPSFVPALMADLLPGESIGQIPSAPSVPSGSSVSDAPPSPPLFPPFVGPGVPPIIPGASPTPQSPPVSTPEPDSFALVLSGTAFVLLLATFGLPRNR
jgi:hypothetical protein